MRTERWEGGPMPGGEKGLYILGGDVCASWVRFPRPPLAQSCKIVYTNTTGKVG
jgi:hypothetical protein